MKFYPLVLWSFLYFLFLLQEFIVLEAEGKAEYPNFKVTAKNDVCNEGNTDKKIQRKVNRYNFSDATVERILGDMNIPRRKVAAGEAIRTIKFPTASNMNELIYDAELAKLAQASTDKCNKQGETSPPKTASGETVGQFVRILASRDINYYDDENTVRFMFEKSSKYVKDDKSVFLAEEKELEPVIQSYDPSKAKGLAQILWATSSKVGCGYTQWNVTGAYPYISQIICYFTPAGDIEGQPVYKQGAACSACDPKTTCVDNLCQAKEDETTDSGSTSGGQSGASTLPDGFSACANNLGLICKDVCVGKENYVTCGIQSNGLTYCFCKGSKVGGEGDLVKSTCKALSPPSTKPGECTKGCPGGDELNACQYSNKDQVPPANSGAGGNANTNTNTNPGGNTMGRRKRQTPGAPICACTKKTAGEQKQKNPGKKPGQGKMPKSKFPQFLQQLLDGLQQAYEKYQN